MLSSSLLIIKLSFVIHKQKGVLSFLLQQQPFMFLTENLCLRKVQAGISGGGSLPTFVDKFFEVGLLFT